MKLIRKRRIEKNIVETRLTSFNKIFDGHKMAFDDDAELAFDDGAPMPT